MAAGLADVQADERLPVDEVADEIGRLARARRGS